MCPQPVRHEAPRPMLIPAGADTLVGDLLVPVDASGLVLFAHGSGSGRFSPRNRQVAHGLYQAQIATLLLDLLTEQEEDVDQATAQFRFDIPRLAERLVAATDWALHYTPISRLPLAYFGASTGAAAALIAAATRPQHIAAVVSRGGRPDLAAEALPRVQAPTLLIVGGHDPQVIELNRQAFDQLRCSKQLEIVPGATHLFEEPGALEQVTDLAQHWFSAHFKDKAL